MDFKIVEGNVTAESQNNKSTGAIASFFGEEVPIPISKDNQRGLTTFLFEYRVDSRHNTSPIECIKDARSALRFLKQNHSIFNIDPQKIIASGGSASYRCC